MAIPGLSEDYSFANQFDLTAKELVPFFEKSNILPVPQNLEYKRFLELTDHKHWNDFKDNITTLLAKLTQKPMDDFNSKWTTVMEDYRVFYQKFLKTDKNLGIGAPIVEFALEGLFIGKVAKKAIEIKRDNSIKKDKKINHGRMLAQIVYKAQQKSWPPQWLPDGDE